MKARGALVQAVLAALALIAAYFTWQRPKENVTGEKLISVISSTKASLELVHFEDGARFVELKRDGKDVWVTLGPLPGKEAATVDAGVSADGGVVQSQTIPLSPLRTVRGNDRAEKTLVAFAPFEAVRALGVLPDAKLEELGLKKTDRKLVLTVSGAKREFTIGNPTTGIVGAYAREVAGGAVFLLSSTFLNELDPTAQTLVERRLHTFRAQDYDELTVSAEGKSKTFVQTNAEIPQTAKLSPKETPDKPDDLAKNWHDKVFNRLVVTEVLGRGELPKSGEPKPMLRVEYRTRTSDKGWIEIGKTATGEMYARTELTASWVGIHFGSEELLLEGKKIAGAM